MINEMTEAEMLKDFQRDGYILLKKIFTDEEIDDYKNRIATLAETKKEYGEVMCEASLRPILLDDRVLNALRAILGEKIIYFGDSTYRYDAGEMTRGFHKDSLSDYVDPSSTEYPIVRVGVYMQDHVNHSGGLKVRRGSHRHVLIGRRSIKRLFSKGKYGFLKLASFRLGRAINIDIEKGDLAIWSLRTFHSGHAVRLKMFPKLCLNPRVENYIPKSWVLPYEGSRAVLFAAFGAPSASLETYIKDRAEHPSNSEYWKATHYDDPEVIEDCSNKGVELRFDGIELCRN